MKSCIPGNISFFRLVNVSNSRYNDMCWMPVVHPPENDTCHLTSHYTCTVCDLLNEPSFVYTDAQSIISGLIAALMSTAGTILNLLVILAILNNSKLRKDYLTPAIVSLASTDLVFSLAWLPFESLRLFLE